MGNWYWLKRKKTFPKNKVKETISKVEFRKGWRLLPFFYVYGKKKMELRICNLLDFIFSL